MPIYFLIVATAIAQFLLFLGHWFVYKTVVHFFALPFPAALALKIVFFILSLTALSSFLIAFRSATAYTRTFYILAMVWLGTIYWLIFASAFVWLGEGLVKIFHVSLDAKIFAALMFGLAFIISISGVINVTNTRVTRLNIHLDNLPETWRGRTAVWASDIHLGQIWNYGTASETAEIIGELNPDIIFIGGDLYDGETADLDHLAEPFSRLSPPKGIYFITGNHEEFGDNAKFLKAAKNAGMRILDNEMVNIDGLQLIGVDYRDASDRKNFQKILGSLKIDKNQPSILLKHAPFDIDISQEAGISLQLSGHTHKGQMLPINFITHLVYQGYDFGLKKAGNMIEYTSSGVRLWGPPMRVATISEIVYITFQ